MKYLTIVGAVIFMTAINLQAQFPVYAFRAESFRTGQSGATVDHCLDNNLNTIYHSMWSETGVPDKLTFYFTDKVRSINKIEYVPRNEGLNGVWTKLHIYYTTRSAPDTWIKLSDQVVDWPLDNEPKTFEIPAGIDDPYSVIFTVNAAGGYHSSCAEMRFYSAEEMLPDGSVDCVIPVNEFVQQEDTKVNIIAEGSFASSYQPGEDIDKSFDNDVTTLYHSNYGGGTAIFPVELNYHFDGSTPIDYLEYTPRLDGTWNGYFGKVDVAYNTSDTGPGSQFTELTTFNFLQSGAISNIYFPERITPRNIKITIHDGANNFVSCAEMAFYAFHGGTGTQLPYKNIFKDNLYSSLFENVEQSTIDTIASPFYKTLANCLYNETYNKRYRLQTYEPYPTLNDLASTLKISTYDRFENATGIFFESNSRAAIFVDQLPQESVYLRIRDFHNEADVTEELYQLKAGLNILEITNKGLGYISYYTDDPDATELEIHIVSGKINGIFDINTSTNEDWTNLLENRAYPKMDILGKYVHLVYDKVPMATINPEKGLEFIARYDSIVKYERVLMGLYKYNKSPVNRQFAWTESGGGWYAGGLGAHFDLTWGSKNSVSVDELDLWGIAHEFGHVNQIRPGLRWVGTTEVTNNMHSLWVTYKMNKDGEKYTRLESESLAANATSAELTGGRINGFIEKTAIEEQPLQTFTDDYHFKVLVPFWQLELYYQEAGACRDGLPLDLNENPPVEDIDYAHWLGYVSEKVRTTDESNLTDGELLLNFVRNTCDAVQEDLTDFFTKTGFLRPVDVTINDYWTAQLTITQAQIDELVNEIKSKNYEKPVSPVINYITAHSVSTFRDKLPLEGENNVGVELIDTNEYRHLSIDHNVWKNAVAFETYDLEGSLIHVATTATGDLSGQTTNVQYPDSALNVFAVGYDGTRLLVYPKQIIKTANLSQDPLKIYPNPIKSNQQITIDIPNPTGDYEAELNDFSGKKIMTMNGNVSEINARINKELKYLIKGAYLISLKNGNGNYFSKLIVQ